MYQLFVSRVLVVWFVNRRRLINRQILENLDIWYNFSVSACAQSLYCVVSITSTDDKYWSFLCDAFICCILVTASDMILYPYEKPFQSIVFKTVFQVLHMICNCLLISDYSTDFRLDISSHNYLFVLKYLSVS